jgi:hypothetical protein
MKTLTLNSAGVLVLLLATLTALGEEPPSVPFKRLDTRSEQELTNQLTKVRLLEPLDPKEIVEADREGERLVRESYFRAGFGKPAPKPAEELQRQALGDALRLRLRSEPDCQLSAGETVRLQYWAERLRLAKMVSTINRTGQWEAPKETGLLALSSVTGRNFAPAKAIPAVVQMLQVEEEPTRTLMVELLEKAASPAASQALARTALFDTSPDVRERAVQALKKRAADEYRAAALEGFRHPWAPVAEHVAELLVAVGDRSAVPELKKMLNEPELRLPMQSDSSEPRQVRELVRLNHLQNCTLCHAASTDALDPLRGKIPVVGQSLAPAYYGGPSGPFVRADITFLRQDFSIMLPVENAAPWPTMQRFDFLLRRRDATAEELEAQQKTPANANYPQREAVRWALKELSR